MAAKGKPFRSRTRGVKKKKAGKHRKQNTTKQVKPRKTVVKNILENPFVLDSSYVSAEYEKEIVMQLESCCRDLKIPACSPPRKEIQSLKGEERKKYMEEFKKAFVETLQSDPSSWKQYELAKEARSHLIFGYNAVMRALEKNSLAGILVKQDAQPSFVVQTFLPGCVNKCIPLVPVLHLDKLLQSEETLAVKHSVMVLGLKPSVKEETCRFYPLYEKMTKILADMLAAHNAVKVENGTENVNFVLEKCESTVDKVMQDSSGVDECIPVHIPNYYHLKRTRKDERVFIPRDKKVKTEELDVISLKSASDNVFNWDLIPVKADNKGTNFLADEQKPFLGAFRNKKAEVKKPASAPAPVDFSLSFFIDTSGDVEVDNAAEVLKKQVAVGEKRENSELKGKENKKAKKIKNPQKLGKKKAPGSSIKKKMKKMQELGEAGNREKKERKFMKKKSKPPVSYPYIAAKTKRIKNNPNRKGSSKQ